MNVSKTIYKAMLWGLPTLSFIGTWWLPAALQISFFSTGIVAAIQTVAFRNPKTRHWLGMTPMPPPKPTEDSAPAAPGTLRLRNDQYRVGGDVAQRGPTYRTLFRGVEKPAPPGMNAEKYEEARAALASGHFLHFRKLYGEAVKDMQFARLPGKDISSVRANSRPRYEAPREPGWRAKLTDGVSSMTTPMKNFAKNKQDIAKAKQTAVAAERYEASRQKEEAMRLKMEKRLRAEQRARRSV